MYLRNVLSKPLSTLYVSRRMIKGFHIDYSVGDLVSRNHSSLYRVVDGKIMRKELDHRRAGEEVVIVNPPGTLSLNTFTMLKVRGRYRYYVFGEEDLIVLGIGREYRCRMIYGQPRSGVVVMGSDPYYLVNIIKAFKLDIVDYRW